MNPMKWLSSLNRAGFSVLKRVKTNLLYHGRFCNVPGFLSGGTILAALLCLLVSLSLPLQNAALAGEKTPDQKESLVTRLQFRLVMEEASPKGERFLFKQKGREPKEIHLSRTILFDETDIKSVERKSSISGDMAILELTFTEGAAERFASVTGENLGRRLAVVFDGEVLVAPAIKQKIPHGKVVITYEFDPEKLEVVENAIRKSIVQTDKQNMKTFEGKDQSLQGIVKDEEGRPLEGVKITNWFPFGSNPQETWTNGRGLFFFEKRNGYVVKAEKEGFAPSFEEFRERYYGEEGKNGPLFLNIEMNKGGTVRGRILDEASGKPLVGARVIVKRKANDPHVGNLPYDIWESEALVTDKEGRFLVERVPPGLVMARAEAEGYAGKETAFLTLEKNKRKEFDISLERKTPEQIREDERKKREAEEKDYSLGGVVRDLSGKPLDGVKISNYSPHGSNPRRRSRVQTASSGLIREGDTWWWRRKRIMRRFFMSSGVNI